MDYDPFAIVERDTVDWLGAAADTADNQSAFDLEGLADRDPLLRVHAVWAAGRLGRHDLLVGVDASEPEVAEELAAAGGRVGL